MSAVTIIAAAVIGAFLGSYVNTLTTWHLQWPTETVRHHSICPACHRRMRWYDKVPFFSWAGSRRRACCGAHVPIRYAIVEVSMTIAAVVLFVAPPSGRSVFDGNFHLLGVLAFVAHLLFVAMLLAAAFSDMERGGYGVPTELIYAGIVVGCVMGILVPDFAGRFDFGALPGPLSSCLFNVSGLVAGVGISQSIRVIGTAIFKKEALGFGVVAVTGLIGSFLGWAKCILAFFIAPFFGLFGMFLSHYWKTVWGYEPFGTQISYPIYLAIGAMGVMFSGDLILGALPKQEWHTLGQLIVIAIFWVGMVVAFCNALKEEISWRRKEQNEDLT